MKILILDDNKEFIKILQKTLKSKYDITIADTYFKAKENITKNNFDLILAEIKDSEDNNLGIELLKILNASSISIPIIMMANKSDISYAVECLKLGAIDFIEKSKQFDETVEKILHAINNVSSKPKSDKSKTHLTDFHILFVVRLNLLSLIQ